MSGPQPRVGDWYLDRDKHDFLCVVDVHDADGVINVRDEYGEIDEIEFEEWETMNLVLCSTPREWKQDDADYEADDEIGGHIDTV
jgi:hypothetical protein